jgi:hypothetical protein
MGDIQPAGLVDGEIFLAPLLGSVPEWGALLP